MSFSPLKSHPNSSNTNTPKLSNESATYTFWCNDSANLFFVLQTFFCEQILCAMTPPLQLHNKFSFFFLVFGMFSFMERLLWRLHLISGLMPEVEFFDELDYFQLVNTQNWWIYSILVFRCLVKCFSECNLSMIGQLILSKQALYMNEWSKFSMSQTYHTPAYI